jgi:hypothetical protein
MGIRRVKIDGLDNDHVRICWLDETANVLDERIEKVDALFADENASLLRFLCAPNAWPESYREDGIELIVEDELLRSKFLTANNVSAIDGRHLRLSDWKDHKLRGHSNNSIFDSGADPVGGQSNE